ncbi:hypothetical protein predicted by Glimmer/Critica [Sorangium cellulosum So ce56]|uniref:Uncharacterized protein n=1 Tax=Sorangium cellulosum (strain So ce56) TaxID=448385 RepID=A9FV36_SORC5|nr:hypothetical protein predicted by Glimmer/Critica [Sorangium cellulosum So ce56]
MFRATQLVRRPMALRGGPLTLLLRGVDANLSGTHGDHGQLVMRRASEPPRWGVEDASKDASDGTAGPLRARSTRHPAWAHAGARTISPPFEGLCGAFAAWYELC